MIGPEEIKAELQKQHQFEDIILNVELPKMKKLLKTQNPQQLTTKLNELFLAHKEAWNFLVQGINDRYVNEANTLLQIKNVIILFNQTAHFFTEHKRAFAETDIPIVLELDVYQKLQVLLAQAKHLYTCLARDYKNVLIELIIAQQRLGIFCNNQCCYIKNNKIYKIDWKELCLMTYMALARTYFQINELAQAELFVIKAKKLIDSCCTFDDFTNLFGLATYYAYKSTIAFRHGNVLSAKEFALKNRDIILKMKEKNHAIDAETYKIYMDIMLLAYQNGDLDQALFWGKFVKSHVKISISSFQRSALDFVDDKSKELPCKYGLIIENLERVLRNVGALINTYKERIFKQKCEALEAVLRNYQASIVRQESVTELSDFSIPNNKMKYIINIHINGITDVGYLLRLLRKNNVICRFSPANGFFVIYNLINIDIKLFEQSLSNWKNFTEIKANLASVPIDTDDKLPLEPPIDKENNTELEKDKNIESSEVDKTKIIKRRDLPTSSVANNLSDNKALKQQKIINWGENYPSYFLGSNTIFKLRGDLKRHYLTIKPELLEEICQTNPMAAKNLLQICERGKQLGDSRGDKGILVTGDKVKAKDSSKPYRFFGRVVATMKDEKQKIRTLIEFNGWTENHKQKAPEIVPEQSVQRSKAKPG